MAEQSTGLSDFMDAVNQSAPEETNEPQETEAQLNEEPTQQVEEEVEPAQTIDPEVEKATRDGWKPKDQWKGNPDDWVSAKKFNERGEMIGRIRELQEAQKQFDDRLENQRKFMQLQQEQERKKLEAERQNAVELADVDKFNSVQKQLDDLKQPEVEEPKQDNQAAGQQVVDDWNAANPWIFEESPKAFYAKGMFSQYLNQGMTPQQAVQQVDVAVAKQFPPSNPRREQPATTEAPRSNTRGQRREASLQWNQLTRQELEMWHLMKDSAFKGDKEAFLQSVKDSRG